MKHIKLFENFGKALMSPEEAAAKFTELYGEEPTDRQGDVNNNLAKFIGDNREELFGDPEFSVMDWYNMEFTDQLVKLLGADKDYVSAAYEEGEYEGRMPNATDMKKIIGD